MEEATHSTEVTDGGERKRVLQVDVIVPAYKPGEKFSRLLKIPSIQTYPIDKIIVMNTEKVYWNEKGFEGIGNLEAHHLSKEEFDHGATKNRGTRYSEADAMVFMTDDVVPADEKLIGNLTAVFERRGTGGESVIMAYTRRLPSKDCTMAERLTRSLNYPEDSFIKTKEDLGRVGIRTFFASDVCCAYNREKFWFQGDFIHKTIFNEDMVFAGKAALQDDYAIVYIAETRIIHSHNYGCVAQLRRNLDLAVSQVDRPGVFGGIRPEGEGIRLIRQTACYLVARHRPWLVPRLIVKNRLRYAGYRLSRCRRFLPVRLAAVYNMDKEYWK